MLAKRNDGFLHAGVSVIHGVALGKTKFKQVADAGVGVGLIWSPRSNIELYGATTNVRGAKEAGVRIAPAPDWSPSGSDVMIEELKYAATWNASQVPPVFDAAELVRMATVVPAHLAARGISGPTVATSSSRKSRTRSPNSGFRPMNQGLNHTGLFIIANHLRQLINEPQSFFGSLVQL